MEKKTAGAIEKKTAWQSLAAEEALLSIATYKEGEMAALIESITSPWPNTKKSTAIVSIHCEYEAHRHIGQNVSGNFSALQ